MDALSGPLSPDHPVRHQLPGSGAEQDAVAEVPRRDQQPLPAGQGASYHTSRAVVTWLKAQPRIMFLYLPAWRPDLNPVELIWGILKEAVSANRSFAHLFALGQFI